MRLEPIKEYGEGTFEIEPPIQEELEVKNFTIISK